MEGCAVQAVEGPGHGRPEALGSGAPPDALQGHFWPDTNSGNAQPDGVLFFNNTRGVDESGAITDRGNNTGTSVWLPRTHGTTVLYKDRPQGSDWFCVEAHIKLNDPGQSNGVEEFWIDGQLEGRRSDQNHVGDYTEYGLNQVVFDNYWNGGSPQQNVFYRDSIVVSTERIGCLDDSPSPSPPPPPPPPAALPPAAPILLP